MASYAARFNAAVAAELRGERGAQQITVEALAEKAGMVKGTLLRYLNGKRDIPVPALAEICQALGVDPGDVLDKASARVAAQQV
ncbi:helix-turn-helix domain-containing protein [Microbacterium sp. SORGH_AS_0862]|uniref:helix-turn-helix domain-containing protein n=1 Tax=Microbacterium sp. SORGH_AS_0862 TaxID=3041789 RepID=UPI003593AFB2